MRRTPAPQNPPDLAAVRRLAAEYGPLVAGCDEVGRGALAGPVSVGLVMLDNRRAHDLEGVRDSKLLTPAKRESLVSRIQEWALGCAVGHASAEEIDRDGIMGALRLAGARAQQLLKESGLIPDVVHLDGNHDWFTRTGRATLLGIPEELPQPPVVTSVKADLRCLVVAAASVLAKVERDTIMAGLAERDDRFGWEGNKGYATATHRAAIRAHGPVPWHRRSWNLTANSADGVDAGKMEL